MRIDWTAPALEDRDYIYEYVRGDNPRAAERIDTEIETQVDLLADSPWIGRGGRIAGTRELVINRSPFTLPSTRLKATLFLSFAYCMARSSGRLKLIVERGRLQRL